MHSFSEILFVSLTHLQLQRKTIPSFSLPFSPFFLLGIINGFITTLNTSLQSISIQCAFPKHNILVHKLKTFPSLVHDLVRVQAARCLVGHKDDALCSVMQSQLCDVRAISNHLQVHGDEPLDPETLKVVASVQNNLLPFRFQHTLLKEDSMKKNDI